MRKTTVTCDECKGAVEDGFAVSEARFVPMATWEGRKTSWDFCSVACLVDYWERQREH